MSKEHIWPRWASALLPAAAFHRIRMNRQLGLQAEEIVKAKMRQGPVNGARVRVVCRKCNSGWMSVLEETVRPLLSATAQGFPVSILPDGVRAVRMWAFVKMAVAASLNPELEAPNPASRRYVFENREAPEEFHLWIGLIEKAENVAGFHIDTLTTAPVDQPRPDPDNVLSVELGFGRSLLVMWWNRDGVQLPANPITTSGAAEMSAGHEAASIGPGFLQELDVRLASTWLERYSLELAAAGRHVP